MKEYTKKNSLLLLLLVNLKELNGLSKSCVIKILRYEIQSFINEYHVFLFLFSVSYINVKILMNIHYGIFLIL